MPGTGNKAPAPKRGPRGLKIDDFFILKILLIQFSVFFEVPGTGNKAPAPKREPRGLKLIIFLNFEDPLNPTFGFF